MIRSNTSGAQAPGAPTISRPPVIFIFVGEIWLATKVGDGGTYAIKVLDKKHTVRTQSTRRAIAEKKILQKVRHPFVISLKFAFQDETKLYLVLDYVGGGDMYMMIEQRFPASFTEDEVKFYCAELFLALEHLHSQGVIFRDLKPENVLLSMGGHVVLTDFGLAKENLLRSTSFIGTPHYMSPEILRNQDHGPEVDWWALGTPPLTCCTTRLHPFFDQKSKRDGPAPEFHS